jgi:hypothetical protein
MVKLCAVCNKPFEVSPAEAIKERHCSRTCRDNIEARFWSRVDKSGDCWVWTAGKFDTGYGRIWIGSKADGKDFYAHRVSYEMAYGSIPDGFDILHICDNPPCVRPDHLWAGTHSDNMQDMLRKGRRRNLRGSDNGNSRLAIGEVVAIRKAYAAGRTTYKLLAEQYHVNPTTIMNIVRGKQWKA